MQKLSLEGDKLQTLKLEVAILQGKLGRHQDTLTTLVKDVGDCISAEAYCALGGTWVIPPKVRATVGERCGLQKWAALAGSSTIGLSASMSSGAGITERMKVSPSINGAVSGAGSEQTRVELLKKLLEVYMSGGYAICHFVSDMHINAHMFYRQAATSITRTSRLLNAQALNLDPIDV